MLQQFSPEQWPLPLLPSGNSDAERDKGQRELWQIESKKYFATSTGKYSFKAGIIVYYETFFEICNTEETSVV